MAPRNDTAALRARIAELEAENRALRTEEAPRERTGAGGVLRTVIATVLVVVALLLAPVAALGAWARVQLVDTDRFVATFAPLADDPAVQAFLADQIDRAIVEGLDVDGLVGAVFDGIGSLDLPPRTQSALALLEAPAAQGVRSLISSTVANVVASEQFSQIWTAALRETHSRAIAVIQGDPNAVLQLSDDGVLSLQLAVVITQVREALVQQGFGFAAAIPAIDRTIPLVTADAFVLVRTVYQVAVAAGYWLPWVVLGMLVLAVATARRRLRTLAWIGAGLTVSFLLLAAGLGIGRQFFLGAVSPSVMPAGAAQAMFDQVTLLMSSTLAALVALSIAIAAGAWIAGATRSARAVRNAAGSGFAAVRAAGDRHGIGTGGFGALVDRVHPALVVVIVGLGALALFLVRPLTVGGVLGTAAIVLLALLVVELVRRPSRDPEPAGP